MPPDAAIDSVPAELRELDQWVAWRYEERDGKLTKPPYQPASPHAKASTTQPNTWSSYEAAIDAVRTSGANGAGFVFAEDDPYAGIDFDHCIDGDQINPDVAALVMELDSYTEVSPSGTGLHVIVRAELNGGRRRTSKTPWGGEFESYSSGRFFCMTGLHLSGTPKAVNERQQQFDAIRAKLFPVQENRQAASASLPRADDDELLQKARKAKNGAEFAALYDASEHSYPSDSEADLAICNMLAFWFVEPSRVDQAFRRSARMRPKWDETHGESTYGEQTIEKALAGRTEFYGGNQEGPAPAAKQAEPQTAGEKEPGDELESERDTGEGSTELLTDPNVPMHAAQEFVASQHPHPNDYPVLHHWRGGWWEWKRSRWQEVDPRATRAALYRFTRYASYEDVKDGRTKLWAPNRRKIGDLLEALQAIAHLSEEVNQPGWIKAKDAPEGVIVACGNGLLDVERRTLLDHDPRFFNQTAVPFAFEPTAPAPERWLEFLKQLWSEESDEDSIKALQEWFGYVVSGRLDLHKILLLVGPTRAGKGVITRTLGALVGFENVAGPTLASLATDFGLAPLLGKSLAVISDARLEGRGSQTVVERLLNVSGEDTITVNRKHRDQWTGKLPTRFMLTSNELPRLGDASAAVANRFVALLLTKSWLGKENHELERELHEELPGILNWALDGLERLLKQDRFTRPKGTEEAIIALEDLASPVAAFVRERCEKVPGQSIPVDELWKAWKVWCEDNGHTAKSKQTLGRDLKAVLPGLRIARPRDEDDRHRRYEGIRLRDQS